MPRKGSHRSDRRWVDEDGNIWASKWEHDVYQGLRRNGYRVRRCDESDTIAYTTPINSGACLECGSTGVVQHRTYTADLFVVTDPEQPDEAQGYLVECKGYFARDKRAMFVEVAKELKSLGQDIRIIFTNNNKSTLGRGIKSTPVGYIHRYCKNVIPGVWNSKLDKVDWYEKD